MWRYQFGETFRAQKFTQEKSRKFAKIFESYLVSKHNFLFQKVSIPLNDVPPTHTKRYF